MAEQSRRSFLKSTGLGIAGAMTAGRIARGAVGAGDRISLGVIGCGGRGSGVAQNFAGESGCVVSWVCDPDAARAASVAKLVAETSGASAPKVARDLREILDDGSVDAVLVATPDHWHAPASILACEAGKHVYVEKPCSHNLREGRLLVEAARRNDRVVQHGTQSRSDAPIAGAIQMLREGIIGDVLVSKAWNVQRRSSIGHDKPGDPPQGVDYDQWIGPAPMVPFQKNRFHYHWHWWHDFGTGDMGNDGVHELDYARWGLGVETHPERISALGGKYYFDDDQQFPDTQQVVFEYPGEVGARRMLIFEMRIWSTNHPHNIDNGVEFYGTRGRMLLTKRNKLEIFGERNERIEPKLNSDAPQPLSHHADFLDAIRTGRRPNADIEIGHLSASLCHLGNIATRVQRTLHFDGKREQVVGDDEANGMLRRAYRDGHWAVPEGV